MKEIVKYGLILGVICLVSSGLLAAVNGFTAPRIEAAKAQEEQDALKEAFPSAASFKAKPEGQETSYYIAYDAKNRLIGFVIKSEGKGYSSKIQTLTAVDTDLKISAVKILYQNETPGLGSRVAETTFTGRFAGKDMNTLSQVQAITGATISSRAVMVSVKESLSLLHEALLKEIKNAR